MQAHANLEDAKLRMENSDNEKKHLLAKLSAKDDEIKAKDENIDKLQKIVAFMEEDAMKLAADLARKDDDIKCLRMRCLPEEVCQAEEGENDAHEVALPT